MTTPRVPLSVLDLSPIVSGGTARDAVLNTLDLAARVEAAGYARYWLAEHHFTPGVASAAPAILIGQVAAATSTIRVGSGAVQTGHQTPLSIVEQFGLLDSFFPGRIDLGLGRSGQRRTEALAELAARRVDRPSDVEAAHEPVERVVDGVLIPKPFSFAHLFASPRLGQLYAHLQQPGAETPEYGEQVRDVLGLLAGSLGTASGDRVVAVPGADLDLAVWIFGSSGGRSARVAGELGLPFAANYHVSPSNVLDAVDAYRASFQPSERLVAPHVVVSADVVVAEDAEAARRLASGYGLWVRSIRTGRGAIPFPTPEEADAHDWTSEDQALVADRVDTQFVGDADAVVEGLDALVSLTAADELVVTTITHDHAARVRSHELLAAAWFARGRPLTPDIGRRSIAHARELVDR